VNQLSKLIPALAGQPPSRRIRTRGLFGAARAWTLSQLSQAQQRPLLCVAADEEAAEKLAQDLAFFMSGEGTPLTPNVLQLSAHEVLPWDELVADQVATSERLGALFHLGQGTAVRAVVTSIKALTRKVIPAAVMNQLADLVSVGQEVGRDATARKLAALGYHSSPMVEDGGTFSLRGDILDVFPPLYDNPIRLEFFGDSIESMRMFDADSQRTLGTLESLTLIPARELFYTEATVRCAEAAVRRLAEEQHVPSSKVRERLESIREGISSAGMETLLPGFFEGGLGTVFDYLKCWHNNPLVYLDSPVEQDRNLSEWWEEIDRSFVDAARRQTLGFGPADFFLSSQQLQQHFDSLQVIEGGGLSLDNDESAPVSFHFESTTDLRNEIATHHGEEGALAPLIARLQAFRDAATVVVVACGSVGQVDRLKRLLLDRNVPVETHIGKPGEPEFFQSPDSINRVSTWAHLFVGELSQGFIDAQSHLAVLSDEDIFGARGRRKTRRKKSNAATIAAGFKDLKEGDLCVHADFGVCRYGGLVAMPVGGVKADFLLLEYAGRDKIYLPVSRMRLISKFSGADSEKVALDKLGTGSWDKKKALVKEQLVKMAAELLQLYAQRRAHAGHAFSEPDRYFRQFEADFEFEETVDQQKAIDDVLDDMQRPEPMDRLVCGDVGYGKTEVAMRATFKAVLDRKQVAVLVPTTLLAHQHYNNFKKRFDGYPVTIEVISSLKKTSEVREVLQRAREGRVDVLVGTHKLLNTEVGFRDLGLLVIDEEQKFGVKQKESLRRFQTTVDTLTLTATPIPRTMNMAMAGMRDMSLITTPPQDRRSIRTFVNKFDSHQIQEAILREVQRGGQVFFIHNRVNSIASMKKFLNELVPQVTVVVAHGQMAEGHLEKVMLEFVEKRAQVLLATSIIESGIDISSANTIIINRADHFGLSQLYQIRGRVGRSKDRAYAYLLVPQGRAVTPAAQRRLQVLQSFSELGAGFSIASHDLEIRGAGNLLGKEQSGSIEAVGFELYTQLLEEAIAEVRGEPKKTEIEPELNLPLPAFLPELYVPDVHQRLVLYKRLSQATSHEELVDLRAELIDRFGEAPPEVDNLQEVMLIRQDLRRLQIRQMDGAPGRLALTLGNEARLDPAKTAALVQKSKGLYRLTPDMKLIAKLDSTVQGAEFIAASRKVMRDLLTCVSSIFDNV
jgi:transcription-repair coupling factor (superfamily II helicase)